MPVSPSRLFDLSDDVATKVDVQFDQDARDALIESIAEGKKRRTSLRLAVPDGARFDSFAPLVKDH